jgi:signal transduction histidine kinase
VYRTAQETINNAKKHSGGSVINLEMDYSDPTRFTFTTTDNGNKAGEITVGYGIIGINERVRLLKGKVLVQNNSGKGFLVKIDIPVAQ